jgi:hypothetical protein
MADDDFDEFVRRLNEKKTDADQVDWSKRLGRWKSDVEDLFQTVEGFLAPHVQKGSVRVTRGETTIEEEHIGKYSVPKLIIQIGSELINVKPRGMLIIGAVGRVDVVGPNASARLVVIADEKNAHRWKIATDSSNRLVDLTRDTFFQVLMATADA